MQWIAPSGRGSATDTLEKSLWDAADQFHANSGVSAAQYSQPVLGLIFLRFAEVRFRKQRAILEKAGASSRRGSRLDEPAAYHADGVLCLAPNTRFDFLLNLPEAADIGAKVNEAMRDICHDRQFNSRAARSQRDRISQSRIARNELSWGERSRVPRNPESVASSGPAIERTRVPHLGPPPGSRLPPISHHGNADKIIGKFGAADRLRHLAKQLQALLYAA